MTDDELDLVPTQELLQAVARRARAVVVGILVEKDKKRYESMPFISGGTHECYGMIRELQIILDRQFQEDMEDDETFGSEEDEEK